MAKIQPTEDTNVHGVVSNVSLMKQGDTSPFFDTKICDGKKSVRVVEFTSQQRKCTMDPVAPTNIKVSTLMISMYFRPPEDCSHVLKG